jgi:hypothetical protein
MPPTLPNALRKILMLTRPLLIETLVHSEFYS